MGKLDEQIKLLQRKKAKIDLFQRIIINLGKEKDEIPDFPGLMSEVAASVKSFCETQVRLIENEDGEKPKKVAKTEVSSSEELEEIPEPTKPVGKARVIPKKEDIYSDALKFVTHFKDMVGQEVEFVDGVGNKLKGSLVGASFPNLKIDIGGRVVVIDPRNVNI